MTTLSPKQATTSVPSFIVQALGIILHHPFTFTALLGIYTSLLFVTSVASGYVQIIACVAFIFLSLQISTMTYHMRMKTFNASTFLHSFRASASIFSTCLKAAAFFILSCAMAVIVIEALIIKSDPIVQQLDLSSMESIYYHISKASRAVSSLSLWILMVCWICRSINWFEISVLDNHTQGNASISMTALHTSKELNHKYYFSFSMIVLASMMFSDRASYLYCAPMFFIISIACTLHAMEVWDIQPKQESEYFSPNKLQFS